MITGLGTDDVAASARLPLEGVRILDLTHIVAGPFATLLLADAGAEVIKVEPPGLGETSRRQGPFVTGPSAVPTSAYFMRLNRNKKSITLDLKDPRARALFLRLVEASDGLIENFSPGTAARLGIDYETLKAIKPSLVYASVSGFGHPEVLPTRYAEYPAMAIMIEAFSGIMSQSSGAGGTPGPLGFAMADIFAGALASFGFVAALKAAAETGFGRHVDVAMFDAALSMNERALTTYSLTGKVHSWAGERSMIGPLDVFRTEDGFIAIAAAIDTTWERFCAATGLDHLREDARFQTGPDRARHREILHTQITEWTSSRSSDTVMQLLVNNGVPAAPVRSVDQVFNDPGVLERQMLVQVEDQDLGEVTLVGSPVKYKGAVGAAAPPPRLGGDNVEVFGSLCGLSETELRALSSEGVI